MVYLANILELYAVTWPQGEDGNGSTSAIYFEEKGDANRVASLPIGAWNSVGSVQTMRYINAEGAPRNWIYSSALDWAKARLTHDEMVKHKLLP